jgi:hypothetical protein
MPSIVVEHHMVGAGMQCKILSFALLPVICLSGDTLSAHSDEDVDGSDSECMMTANPEFLQQQQIAAVPSAGGVIGGSAGGAFVPPPSMSGSAGPSKTNNRSQQFHGEHEELGGSMPGGIHVTCTKQRGDGLEQPQRVVMLVSAPTQPQADEICNRIMEELDACEAVPVGSIHQLRLCVRKRSINDGASGSAAGIVRPACVLALASRIAEIEAGGSSQPYALMSHTTFWSLDDYMYIKSCAPSGWDILLRFYVDPGCSVPELPPSDSRGLPATLIGHEMDKAFAVVASGAGIVGCPFHS